MDLHTNAYHALPAPIPSYEGIAARVVSQIPQDNAQKAPSVAESLLFLELLSISLKQQVFSACVEQAHYEREKNIPRTLYVTSEDVFMIGPSEYIGNMKVGVHRREGVPRDTIDMGYVALFRKGFDSSSPATYLEGELRRQEEIFLESLERPKKQDSSLTYLNRAA